MLADLFHGRSFGGTPYSQRVGVAIVFWAASSALGFHEQAGCGGGHLLTGLMVSASLYKCVGAFNSSDGQAGRLVQHLSMGPNKCEFGR